LVFYCRYGKNNNQIYFNTLYLGYKNQYYALGGNFCWFLAFS